MALLQQAGRHTPHTVFQKWHANTHTHTQAGPSLPAFRVHSLRAQRTARRCQLALLNCGRQPSTRSDMHTRNNM